ncbi:MAG: hypothetical protein V2A73_01935, partial [Pseudomonadota bacterium]
MKIISWVGAVVVSFMAQVLASLCSEGKMVSSWWVSGSLLVMGVVYAIWFELCERKIKKEAEGKVKEAEGKANERIRQQSEAA